MVNLKRSEQFHKAYIQIALGIAVLSYSEKRKVGAVIVNGRNIVGYGFNGTINGMDNICEDKVWEADKVNLVTRPNVIHAEMNAVIKAGNKCEGADMYITLFPCNECCKLMAQAGIRTIYYFEDHKTDENRLYGMTAIKLEL